MDKVLWVVISATVIIALAGFVLYIGSDSLQGMVDQTNETKNDTLEKWEISSYEEETVQSIPVKIDTEEPDYEVSIVV